MIRVRSVDALDGMRVRLGFTDGSVGEVDLAPHTWGPVYERVRTDRRIFESVRVDSELGTIVWSDGADMDPDFLFDLTHPAAARKL